MVLLLNFIVRNEIEVVSGGAVDPQEYVVAGREVEVALVGLYADESLSLGERVRGFRLRDRLRGENSLQRAPHVAPHVAPL